ncbi:ketopantoate reductase-like protein [Mycena alexandri]|uniref:Ketopantoate reductase-like protein n=1 Tax=Mycena alexandri TaxID=1745969 RepID=A0AAD6T7G9_9AGAR|nr:ketopantoate reductase-like protein [Mycena alexandri]
MRFHVVGTGTLGSLVAHHLRRITPSNHSITLLHRKARDADRGSPAIHVETIGSRALVSSTGFDRESYHGNSEAIESLIVTTRPSATLETIQQLAPRLSPNSTIVLVQNGLAVYDEIIQTVFRNSHQRPHFILASTTHQTRFNTRNELRGRGRGPRLFHSTMGTLQFALLPDSFGRDFEAGFTDPAVHASERVPRLTDIARPEDDLFFERYRSLRNTVAALLMAESLDAHWRPLARVQLLLRRGLAVDSVIHPLTALMGCRTYDIFATTESMRIAERISQEASNVFEAQLCAETKAWMAANESQQIEGALGIARLPRALEAESLGARMFAGFSDFPSGYSTCFTPYHGERRIEF